MDKSYYITWVGPEEWYPIKVNKEQFMELVNDISMKYTIYKFHEQDKTYNKETYYAANETSPKCIIGTITWYEEGYE